MTNESIIGIINWKRSLLSLAISILLLFVLTFGTYTQYQKKGFINIPIVFFDIFFFLAFLYVFFQFLDRKPIIIVSEKGIAMRKNRIPFIGLKQFEWAEITYFHTTLNVSKGVTTFSLLIGGNSFNKEYSTDLSSLNIEPGEILKLIKQYSLKYNIQDLGRTSKS